MKNGFSLFLATILIIGFFFVLPEKGYSGIEPLGACCINPGGCVEFSPDNPLACFEGSRINGGVCTQLGEGGLCVSPSNTTPIPTLSEWGLIAMAGVLGIIGFMVIRRKKVSV